MRMNHYLGALYLSLTLYPAALSAQTAGTKAINRAELTQITTLTGRGNLDEPIVKVTIHANGALPLTYSSIRLSMKGSSSIDDVTRIKVYTTGKVDYFNPAKADNYLKLGECTPQKGTFNCRLIGEQSGSTQYLWVVYDLSERAKEGDRVDACVLSVTASDETYTLSEPAVEGNREILLAHRRLFAPGDYGAASYRIPAIITAKDGSLVISSDRRKYNSTDLPEDIDVMVNRSTDGGKTWTESVTLAQGTGRHQGYGDAVLVQTTEKEGLLCIFAGGTGFFESTPDRPQRTYVCKSNDHGKTWTPPKEITNQLFGSGCTNEIRKNWHGSFCSSGAGLLGSDGTIYVVAAVRESSDRSVESIANYVYYSKDNGDTWHVSACVKPDNGNEAKIVERNDGTLLVSIRNQQKGARYFATSTNKGGTWSQIGQWNEMIEPGCDGDLIRYTSVEEGYDKNRMLHSVPAHPTKRENVSLFLSYDEGRTWPVRKTICPIESAYSSICVLPDGTIGAYVEEQEGLGYYSMYYINVSLQWLTDGKDSFRPVR